MQTKNGVMVTGKHLIGGLDPYSSSKAAMASVSSWRTSFVGDSKSK